MITMSNRKTKAENEFKKKIVGKFQPHRLYENVCLLLWGRNGTSKSIFALGFGTWKVRNWCRVHSQRAFFSTALLSLVLVHSLLSPFANSRTSVNVCGKPRFFIAWALSPYRSRNGFLLVCCCVGNSVNWRKFMAHTCTAFQRCYTFFELSTKKKQQHDNTTEQQQHFIPNGCEYNMHILWLACWHHSCCCVFTRFLKYVCIPPVPLCMCLPHNIE